VKSGLLVYTPRTHRLCIHAICDGHIFHPYIHLSPTIHLHFSYFSVWFFLKFTRNTDIMICSFDYLLSSHWRGKMRSGSHAVPCAHCDIYFAISFSSDQQYNSYVLLWNYNKLDDMRLQWIIIRIICIDLFLNALTCRYCFHSSLTTLMCTLQIYYTPYTPKCKICIE